MCIAICRGSEAGLYGRSGIRELGSRAGGGALPKSDVFDPERMMNWVDAVNAATVWDTERGVTVKWDATAPDSLSEWGNRP